MRTHFTDFLLLFIAGAGIGVLFFGGLWWTVQRLVTVEKTFHLMISSFFLRTGLALGALYFVMDGQWQRLVPSLLGVMVIRIFMIRVIGHR
jgi:F1F0 ATPase subunit 2